MVNLLKNTMEIIGKMSGSSAGYLYKYTSNYVETISYFGKEGNENGSLNNFFLDVVELILTKNNEIIDHELLKELNSKNKWKSAFARKIWNDANNNEQYYLILLSPKANNFTRTNLTTLSPVIETLGQEVITHISALKGELNNTDGKTVDDDLLNKFSTNLFKGFMEGSGDLVFILDKTGCFVKVNEYGAALLDYDAADLLGMHLIELVSTRHKIGFSRAMHRILEEDKLHSFESSLISKFGNEIVFGFSCRAFKEDGQPVGIWGIAKNITDLKRYEEKIDELNNKLIECERIITIERQRSQRQKSILSELNRMKNEFISNISHELRTPLASIIGFSETIASDPNMPEEMRLEFNEIILNEGKRLAKLINDVLDLSKIESGQIELNKTEFDIIELLNEVVEPYKKIIEGKGLSLTTEIPEEKLFLKGDKEKINRVFGSIINNAVKFTNRGGRIKITAQALYKEFEVIISDTGAGIHEKDLPFIFQKFYKALAPGSDVPGTGLGLVFVKQIVDLHKGFILISSELNKGTSVVIKFPREFKV